MKLSLRMFCLICLISSGSAKISNFQQLDESTHLNQNIKDLQNSENQWEERSNPEPRRSHNSESRWNPSDYNQRQAQNNYLTLNRYENKEPKTRMFKTYGRGKAQLIKNGQAVNVPNEMKQRLQTYPDSITVKALDNENEIKSMRHKGGCRDCPTDQTVVATKGNPFAILPEPCPLNPKMWNHHSGPKPGSKIQEGVHSVRGYIGPKKKFCQYHYQVIVRRCEPLQSKEEMIIECSAENSWGSVCNVSCGNDKESMGPTDLECKEDLTWSNSLPKCKSKNDCSSPKVKADSKISCQTANMTPVDGDIMSNGSTCKFRQNGKEINLICKDGRWKVSRKVKSSLTKKNKPRKDVCNPNPCQNGGICYRSESNSEPLCKCKPQTQGAYCEMRECYYNICENNGLCFIQNNERICYCSPEYNGETCQNYTK